MLTTRGAFVLQIDSESDVPAGKIDGRVEHVLSGRAIDFDTLDALVAFIGDTVSPKVRGSEEP